MRLPELQLAYYKNRMYDPAMGRFLTPDPLGQVDGPNLYAYVLNDPINNVDPWGLQTNKPCAGDLRDPCEIEQPGGGDTSNLNPLPPIDVPGTRPPVPGVPFPPQPGFVNPEGSRADAGGGSARDGRSDTPPANGDPKCEVTALGISFVGAFGPGATIGGGFFFSDWLVGLYLTGGGAVGEGGAAEIQLTRARSYGDFKGGPVIGASVGGGTNISVGARVDTKGRAVAANLGLGVGAGLVTTVETTLATGAQVFPSECVR